MLSCFLVAGVLAIQAVLKINAYMRSRGADDEVDVIALVFHAGAFGVFMIALVPFLFLDALGNLGIVSLEAVAIASLFASVTSFIS